MAGTISISVSSACTATGGVLSARLSSTGTDTTNAPAALYVQVTRESDGASVATGSHSGTTKTFSFPLADGSYAVEGTDQAGNTQTRFITLACGTGSGGGSGGGPGGGSGGDTCDLLVSNVVAVPPFAAGVTGSVRFTTASSRPLVFVSVLLAGTSQVFGSSSGAPGEGLILGLIPNDYELLVLDSDGCEARAPFTVPAYQAPVPVPGCTDRTANNFNGAATQENGTCVYTPAARTPVFGVPMLQTLRFVMEEDTDGSSTFEHADNVLFCQQSRPGQQMRPRYRQKVQGGDPVRVQVLTNYGAVEATVRRQRDGQTVRTVVLTRALQLEGLAPAVAVELYDNGDGFTRLIGAGGSLPLALRAATRVELTADTASGTYRSRGAGIDPESGEAYLVLNRPWQGARGAEASVRWQLSGPGFDVWEANLNLAGLPEGDYDVRLRATDAAFAPAVAVSEPLWLRATHPNTVALDYSNRDNGFGLVFSTGLTPRLRVDGVFFRSAAPAGKLEVHRNSDDSPLLLASTARRLRRLETYQLPDWLHEKLFLICRLDNLRVNGQRFSAGEAAYEWSADAAYPLSSGQIALEQIGWLGAGNGYDAGQLPEDDNLLELRGGGFLRLRGRG
jgi:hypothetical protein